MQFQLSSLIIILISLLYSCSTSQSSDKEIVEINITQAVDQAVKLNLSKLVKDVEIIEVESNIECFMDTPANLYFLGSKYILYHDYRNNQFFLFDRNGKFLNKIGQSGKGPGEYSFYPKATMSKDESKIIVADNRANRVIVFDTEGKVLAQKNLSEHIQSGMIDQIYCMHNDQLILLPRRPYKPIDGFASLVLFDLELNKIGEVLPRANDENLTYLNLAHAAVFANKKGTYFWEMYLDTVFQFLPDGSSVPKFHFTVEKNGLSKQMITSREWSTKIYESVFPIFVNFIPGYLLSQNGGNAGTVLHNLKTGEANQTEIVNDIYGMPIRLLRYFPSGQLCFDTFDWDRFDQYNDIDEIRSMKVNKPELRDKLLNYVENPADDQGQIIIILKMK